MAIKVSETTLTQDQYDVLAAQEFNPKYKLEMHLYNFQFTSHFVSSDVANANGNDFDAISGGGKLVRVTHPGLVAVYNGTSWTEVTIAGYPNPALGEPALAYSSGTYTLYVISSDGIYRSTSSDALTWSAFDQIETWTGSTNQDWRNSLHLACVGVNRLFYTKMDITKRCVYIYYTAYDGMTGITSFQTDVVLTSVPRSIAAIDQATNEDVLRATLYMAIDIPGRVSAKVIDNQVVKTIIRAGGVIALPFTYGRLGDHIEVDVCDPMTSWRYRESVKVSKVRNKYLLSAAGGDGTKQYHFSRYRFYTSKQPDKEWSNGFVLPGINAQAIAGLKFVEFDDYVFAMNRKQMWRSPITFVTGESTVSYDISHRILRYSSNVAEIRQSGLMLSNEDGFFDDKMSPDKTWSLIHYWGFDQSPLVQVAIEEIDSWGRSEVVSDEGEYENVIRVVARDRMAWMTDYVQSEQARYWQAQGMLADNYLDKTQTSYGGLMHTATQAGTFKTKENTLLLASNNEEGVAASVFEAGANWNGHKEIGVRLSQLTNDEYGGIYFRGIDKDNLWAVIYDQLTDRVQLVYRRGGENSIKYVSSTLGRTATSTTEFLYLHVEWRYGTVSVYTSTDSFTFTHLFTYVMDGQQPVIQETTVVTDRISERGSMGVIGKGHSTIDQWDLNPGFMDIGFITDPEGESTPPIKLYPVNTYDADQCLTLTRQGRLFKVALDYDTDTTIVSEIDLGSTIRNKLINSSGDTQDCWGAYHMIYDPFDSDSVIIQGAGGIVVVDDPWGTPQPRFMQATADKMPIDAISYPNIKGYRPPDNQFYEGYLHTSYKTEIRTQAAVIGAPVVGARTRRGYFAWGSDRQYFYTTDKFLTVRSYTLGGAVESISIGPYNTPNYGEILCGCGGAPGSTSGIYRSKNWGETFYWSFFAYFAAWIGGNIMPTSWKYVHIPVTLGENIPNISHTSAWTVNEWQVNMWDVPQPVGWQPFTGGDLIVWIDSHGDRILSGGAVTKGVQSSNLYLSPYNTQIGGPNVIPLDLGGYTSHWNFQALSAKTQWQCMADGRAQYGIIGFRKYDNDWRYDIGDHTDNSGNYNGLVGFIDRYAMFTTKDGSAYNILPDADLHADDGTGTIVVEYDFLPGNIVESTNRNPEPGLIIRHLNGFPTNPDWLVVAGSYIHDADPSTTYPYKFADRAYLKVTTDAGATWHNFSSDLQDKLDGLGYTKGTELSAFANNQWIVSVIPDIRPVSEFIDSDDFEFDLNDLIDDWTDDDWGLGEFPVGPEYAIAFARSRDYNLGVPATVEDAFRTYASFAGVHDFKFYDTYKYDGTLTGWTTYNASLTAGATLVLTPDTEDSRYGAVYVAETPHNYLVSFEASEIWDNGLYLNLRANDLSAFVDHHYWAGFDATGHPVVYKYIPGTGYTLVYKLDKVVDHTAFVQIASKETFYRSEADSFWLVISIWVNKELVCSYMEWIKEPPEVVYYWGISSNSGTFEPRNLRIPQLTDFVEWNSIDPGENVMGGLQRAIEGRYTHMFMRYDGSLFAWRNKQLDVTHTFERSSIEQLERSIDNRARYNHIRMVGAYKEAEYVRDDLGFHRFKEEKNPYLMTLRDCYLEARRQVQREEEQYDTITLATSFNPLREIGDKVLVVSDPYIIDSYNVEITPVQGMATYALRKFIVPD